MMKSLSDRQKQRLGLVMIIFIGMSVTMALTINALQSNLLFFITPTQVADAQAPSGQAFRLGGMVVAGSYEKLEGIGNQFWITDFEHTITVHYNGVLPDLFGEEQGVVARGVINEGIFMADEVLAKHDENYMPPEVQAALNAQQK